VMIMANAVVAATSVKIMVQEATIIMQAEEITEAQAATGVATEITGAATTTVAMAEATGIITVILKRDINDNTNLPACRQVKSITRVTRIFT
jgi:hypothetical protein